MRPMCMAAIMLADHILHIDSEALIVNKPPGLPVDPPRDGSLSVENHLQALMLGYKEWPRAVHWLDRDTSGCLMLGRSAKAHKRLSAAFEAGLVKKRYLAILDGVPNGTEGVIDLALRKMSTAAEGWRIVADPGGKPAQTQWHLLTVVNGCALVAFAPKTGRTHQLRVHAAVGLEIAIMGDPVYGTAHAGGMMLHASGLRLPREGKPTIRARAPFPERFVAQGFDDPDGGEGDGA